MAFNLVKYIKELYFKTGLVVVGVAHFPQMVTAIKDNFECQLVDPK